MSTTPTPWPSINSVAGGIQRGDLHCIMAKAKIGKSHWTPNLQSGDLVIKSADPSFVGRVISVMSPISWEAKGKWRALIRPIHQIEGRTEGKAHWCSMRAWRRVSPLELLAIQGESET